MSQEWLDKVAGYAANKAHAAERLQETTRRQAEQAVGEHAQATRLLQLLEQIAAAQAEQTTLLREILASLQPGEGR